MTHQSNALNAALWRPPASIAEGTPERTALTVKLDALGQRLQEIGSRHERAKLASSLSPEDMLLTDVIWRDLPELSDRLPVFTLDTGRLPPETLRLIETMTDHYGRAPEVFRPDAAETAAFDRENGAFAFYESVALRQACCALRKVGPLERALADADAWITGQRREQSVTRTALAFSEPDAQRGIAKYNPLADWTEREVWTALRLRAVPVSALHDRGYPSIGCAPCTCAVKAGADVRAGRWWWESRTTRECGLHAGPQG